LKYSVLSRKLHRRVKVTKQDVDPLKQLCRWLGVLMTYTASANLAHVGLQGDGFGLFSISFAVERGAMNSEMAKPQKRPSRESHLMAE
jgi:hypothetical protein